MTHSQWWYRTIYRNTNISIYKHIDNSNISRLAIWWNIITVNESWPNKSKIWMEISIYVKCIRTWLIHSSDIPPYVAILPILIFGHDSFIYLTYCDITMSTSSLQARHTATHCNTLQRTATHCNTRSPPFVVHTSQSDVLIWICLYTYTYIYAHIHIFIYI